MLDTRHEDNPILCAPDGTYTERGRAYMSALDNLTGVRKERLRHGRWAAAEGLIYEDFDRATHLRASPNPRSWPRYWSVDFGYTNPFVLQCWAVDPTDGCTSTASSTAPSAWSRTTPATFSSIVAPGGTVARTRAPRRSSATTTPKTGPR
jgi:hypothetical protein